MDVLPYVFQSIDQGLHYAVGLVEAIPDEELTLQPVAGQVINHPAWVLGHLAVSNDFAAESLGGQAVCPPAWAALFEQGTRPQADRSLYPTKAVLLDHLQRSVAAVKDRLAMASPQQLAGPAPDVMRDFFPTMGNFVVFDMTTHAGTHLGQLSAWRRAKGYPALF